MIHTNMPDLDDAIAGVKTAMEQAATLCEKVRGGIALMPFECLVWRFPPIKKTKNGLIMADESRDAFENQMMIGIILNAHPTAFTRDAVKQFWDCNPSAGLPYPFVTFNPNAGFGGATVRKVSRNSLESANLRCVPDMEIRPISPASAFALYPWDAALEDAVNGTPDLVSMNNAIVGAFNGREG
jgi:hypothetical protein